MDLFLLSMPAMAKQILETAVADADPTPEN
jgi:hypothetical protein